MESNLPGEEAVQWICIAKNMRIFESLYYFKYKLLTIDNLLTV